MPKITIDPGHVKGYNKGYVNGYYEGTRMFEFAQVLATQLKNAGFTVVCTRAKVTDNPSLPTRGNTAVNNGSDMFLSLHTNAPASASQTSVRGVLCYRSVQNNNKALGEKLTAAIARVMNTTDRKTATWPSETRPGRDYLTVLDKAAYGKVPVTLLLEMGFHTNPDDCSFWMSDSNMGKAADAITGVLVEYYSKKEQSASVAKTQNTETQTTGGNTVTLTFDVLKRGIEKSDQVKMLQTLLKAKGFKDKDGNALKIDGDFGSKTEYAVTKYQEEYKLEADGKAGPQTLSHITGGRR